jgi:hypothetical protein
MQQEHSSDFIVVKAPSIRQAAQCAGGGSNSAQLAAGPSFPAWRANVVNDPARDHRRAGSLVRCSAAPLLLHDDRRADLDPVIEIDHVLIGQANAAR